MVFLLLVNLGSRSRRPLKKRSSAAERPAVSFGRPSHPRNRWVSVDDGIERSLSHGS